LFDGSELADWTFSFANPKKNVMNIISAAGMRTLPRKRVGQDAERNGGDVYSEYLLY
jgi:hypothetical protein